MNALIVRNDAQLSIAFTEEAKAIKESALTTAALIGKVTNANEQAEAVTAQRELQQVLSSVEKARKACKEPVLEYGRKIDDAANQFKGELGAEMLRISRMVGDFQQLEQAKERAALAARNSELSKLEREKAAAVAQAKSHEQLDAIAEHFDRKAQAMPVITAARVEGQIVRQDFDVEITNIWDLARCHPTCVDIKPRMSEIKELLKTGAKLAGVKATPIVKAGVRANGRQQEAIEA